MIKRLSEKGFTIIELLIATTVFSVVLLLCTTAMLQIGRVYYKGITSTQTQEAARTIMDEITQTIQFAGGKITLGPPADLANPDSYFCAGNKRYNFLLNKQVVNGSPGPQGTHRALVVDESTVCSSENINVSVLPAAFSNPRDLLPVNMRLAKLKIEPLSNNLYQVTVRIVYGHQDVLADTLLADGTPGTDGIYDACAPGRDGTQFCAVSELSTTVQKRVK